MPGPIDLRSDTVTRPTPAMREVIARADVGDDALGDDPTALLLEERVAELLGKQAALFFPSGIMANEAALALLAPRGSEVIVEATSHFFDWELGATAALSGVQLRPVSTPEGLLTPHAVEAAIRPPLRLQIRTAAVCLENTHNAAGGKVHDLVSMNAVHGVAARHGLPVHLDGARLWNAAAATDTAEREFAACADTVMVTLSKGLGCPAGSLLAGTATLIERARIVRRRWGGAMRQIGILAAAGLHALRHHLARLADDHARAARLASALASAGVVDPAGVRTNIVRLDLAKAPLDAPALGAAAEAQGVLISVLGPGIARLVTHLDVDDADIARAIDVLTALLTA